MFTLNASPWSSYTVEQRRLRLFTSVHRVFSCVHRMRSTDMATMNAPPSALNTETTIALSQSMDSVNTTPEEEVSEQCSLHYSVVSCRFRIVSCQSELYRTVYRVISNCIVRCVVSRRLVSHSVSCHIELYCTLYRVIWNCIVHCIVSHRSVSHSVSCHIDLYRTLYRVVPCCIPREYTVLCGNVCRLSYGIATYRNVSSRNVYIHMYVSCFNVFMWHHVMLFGLKRYILLMYVFYRIIT